MGSQSRMVRQLMEHYVISDEDAWKLVPLFSATEIGDDISDALDDIREGECGAGLGVLTGLHKRLGTAIGALGATMAKYPLRKPP